MPNGAKKKQTPKKFRYTPLLQNDYMSFIRVAFAVHLQSSILNVTKGCAKLKPREELGFSSDLDFTSPDSARMFLLNDTTTGRWTASIKEYASELAQHMVSDDQLVSLTRKFIMSRKHFPIFRTSYYDTKKSLAAEKQKSDKTIASLQVSLQELNNNSFYQYLGKLIEQLQKTQNTEENSDQIDALVQLRSSFNVAFEGAEEHQQAAV
jgi:hypothetical protein